MLWPDAAAFAAGHGLDPLVATKLWENPCWFSFRLNYLALHFNGPVYGYIQERHGLMRPEYVVLYSLSLKDGSTAKAISESSGFPKTTISRAVQSLIERRLIERTPDSGDRRSFRLELTAEGRRITDETLTPMLERERLMLAPLSPAERFMLAELLAKLVVAAPTWPDAVLPGPATV
ncbi:MarR family transcriptional regulator [Siculibacillus lacustris]|uniref:MarR family transcriptional regulator n=1 Tax=Siculibacillus lacustris TaxID=1549641 RepID=A0A4Q9VZF5_9HYPH|nr:MarR family winged helix-turn-helix transcriptional regulator [Siculibacillus lacustris]TBW41188.1 MarR family transcriptional regulator [Siculibacillus lacustris]